MSLYKITFLDGDYIMIAGESEDDAIARASDFGIIEDRKREDLVIKEINAEDADYPNTRYEDGC